MRSQPYLCTLPILGPFLGALLVFCSLLVPPALLAERRVSKIVVLPVSVASGIEEKTGGLMEEILLAELSRYLPEGVGLVGSTDIAAVLGLEQQKQLLGCTDSACIAEIGNAMGASHLYTMSIGKVGDQYIVSYKFLNTRDASVLSRKVLYLKATGNELTNGVRQAANELALSQGWTKEAFVAKATKTAPEPAGEQPEGEAEIDPLLLAGGGVAGLGGMAVLGLGGISAFLDLVVVGNPSTPSDERGAAADASLLMSGGAALGGAFFIAGLALVAISLL